MIGQHRFEALKELNWEVMYYVDDAVTSRDLISINNTQKNWGLLDYIHYYASLGNDSYIKLERICKDYEDIPLKVIAAAVCKKYVKERVIKRGDVVVTDEDVAEGIETLEFINRIRKNIKVKITAKGIFFYLIVKTYYLQDIDRDKLYNSIVSRYGTEN